jgi:hypothetical protein
MIKTRSMFHNLSRAEKLVKTFRKSLKSQSTSIILTRFLFKYAAPIKEKSDIDNLIGDHVKNQYFYKAFVQRLLSLQTIHLSLMMSSKSTLPMHSSNQCSTHQLYSFSTTTLKWIIT